MNFSVAFILKVNGGLRSRPSSVSIHVSTAVQAGYRVLTELL